MPISLKKGQKVSLTKSNPGLKNVLVGVGWDVNAFDTGGAFDLDGAAFLLTDSGKVSSSADFVFYGNLAHASGAVVHQGDNLTGAGEGDDEQILIDLTKVPANISKIAFTVTIYEAEERRQNFGQVSNAFIRICNQDMPSSASAIRIRGRRSSDMTWARISRSRRRSSSESSTRTEQSGNSMRSAAAIREVSQLFAAATESI